MHSIHPCHPKKHKSQQRAVLPAAACCLCAACRHEHKHKQNAQALACTAHYVSNWVMWGTVRKKAGHDEGWVSGSEEHAFCLSNGPKPGKFEAWSCMYQRVCCPGCSRVWSRAGTRAEGARGEAGLIEGWHKGRRSSRGCWVGQGQAQGQKEQQGLLGWSRAGTRAEGAAGAAGAGRGQAQGQRVQRVQRGLVEGGRKSSKQLFVTPGPLCHTWATLSHLGHFVTPGPLYWTASARSCR